MTITIFIVFLILKLAGLVTWSWFWIASPLWIGVLIGFLASLFSGNKIN